MRRANSKRRARAQGRDSRGPWGPAAQIAAQRRGLSEPLLTHLPGYEQRGVAQPVRLVVPTCQATAVDTVEIPAGPFQGEADVVDLPAYRIDRHELTRELYDVYGSSVMPAAVHQADTDQLYVEAFHLMSGWDVPVALQAEPRPRVLPAAEARALFLAEFARLS